MKPFDRTSIILHWLVAAGLLGMIPFGIWLAYLESGPDKTALVQIHKSFGVLVGTAAVLRIAWHIKAGVPAQANAHSRWERQLARFVQIGLLSFSVALPLSGIVKSITYARPVQVFGYPLIPKLIVEKNTTMNELATLSHSAFAWCLAGLIALHVAGALKHHLIDRDDTSRRMLRAGRQ
ncbi:MAG: cytochrome b [Hyphomicrobium sp.]